MTPKTLQILRLTLSPSVPPTVNSSNTEEGDEEKIMERERMARALEITATTGAS
jgi:hypothetical protein